MRKPVFGFPTRQGIICISTGAVQLICAFVLAYAKSRFSHDAAQMMKVISTVMISPETEFTLYIPKLSIYKSSQYCRFGNVNENFIFANIREFVHLRIQSSH